MVGTRLLEGGGIKGEGEVVGTRLLGGGIKGEGEVVGTRLLGQTDRFVTFRSLFQVPEITGKV